MFIARIVDSTRGSRKVDLANGNPGPGNHRWYAGAYHTTLVQPGIKHKGIFLKLHCTTQEVLLRRCANFPLYHSDQASFDEWFYEEAHSIDEIVRKTSPKVHWSLGRSQKLINILLKYCCAAYHCGGTCFQQFATENQSLMQLTNYLHAPVDAATVKYAARLAEPEQKERYSSLSWWHKDGMKKEDYQNIQQLLNVAAAKLGMNRIHFEMAYVWSATGSSFIPRPIA